MERGFGMNYRWVCKVCKKEFEQNVPVDNYDSFKASKHECPFCKKTTLFERVIEFNGLVGETGGFDSVSGTAHWQG